MCQLSVCFCSGFKTSRLLRILLVLSIKIKGSHCTCYANWQLVALVLACLQVLVMHWKYISNVCPWICRNLVVKTFSTK